MIFTLLSRFYRNQRGVTAMMVGVIFIPLLLGVAAYTIDMSRLAAARERAQMVLDSAALASVQSELSVDATVEANNFFNANFPPNYMNARFAPVVVATSPDGLTSTFTVVGNIPYSFAQLIGGGTGQQITISTQITRVFNNIELALVMDTTGSMSSPAGGGISKIDAAKRAANDLLNLLYGSKPSLPGVWISLVPFAGTVNVGTAHADWLAPNTFNWGPSSWGGCVDAREAGGRDVTDDPPSAAPFPAYYWASDARNPWVNLDGTFILPLDPTIRGPNYLCPPALTPMTAQKASIATGISAMEPRGNTHVGLGAVWAWRLLSPRWKGLWGGEMNSSGLPHDYYDANSLNKKVVIIMTDGENTSSNDLRTAYGYLYEGRLGTTVQSAAVTELDRRFTQVCTAMKSNNILIYTIALGDAISDSAIGVLKGCASSQATYFRSPSTDDLSTIFKKIGNSLAKLYISQ